MNNNSLYKDLSWAVFEKTGDIGVFLEYKQFGELKNSDGDESISDKGTGN